MAEHIDIVKIVKMICEYHDKAVYTPYVQKPWAWALYQTWKWVDSHEKSKKTTEALE